MLVACEYDNDPGEAHDFVVRVTNVTPSESLFRSGTFDTPEGGLTPSPIGPGQRYSFDVVVEPGSQLQIITMFVESNDAFVAFRPGGVALWTPTGEPRGGDFTKELVLYDAGTELNEPLGAGPNQAPRQSEPGAGVDQSLPVTVITDGASGAATGPDGVLFPAITDFVELHVVHRHGSFFRVVISNVSAPDLLGKPLAGASATPASLSPGVFAVQAPEVRWFRVGELASPALKSLAEDADPEPHARLLAYLEGVSSYLSSVAWAVHGADAGLYALGAPASAGLEQLVEDARPQALLAELGGRENLGGYGLATDADEGPVIEPGQTVEFQFRARPGDHLSFITGKLAANDKFIGSGPRGIPLFHDDGRPQLGNLGWALGLFDAGTEVDESPGLGPNQFERQVGVGAGLAEHGVIREVRGEWMGWSYPRADRLVYVRLELLGEDQ